MKNTNIESMIINDKWDRNYLRDKPFMAFGSMANAYGLVNKGKGIDIDTFINDMKEIFDAATCLSVQLSNRSKTEGTRKSSAEIDLPTEEYEN